MHKHKPWDFFCNYVWRLCLIVFHAVDALQQGQNSDAQEAVYWIDNQIEI